MITKKIIDYVKKNFTRGGVNSAKKIKDYISIYEPEFEKYIQSTTWEDIKSLVERFGIPPTNELMEGLSSKIIGGKIEGYLIHAIAQDQFWNHKYGINTNDGKLHPEDKFKLFIDGRLDPKYYNYKLTNEEENDSKNFKKIALENFKKNQEIIKIENELSKMENNNKEKPSDKQVKVNGDLMD